MVMKRCAWAGDDRGFGRDHRVAAERLDARDRESRGEFVARDDGARIAEALVTVNHSREVDTAIGLGEQLRERRFLHHDGECRWRDDVGIARSGCRFDRVIERARGEDGASKLAHLLSTDEIGDCGRKCSPYEFGVH